MGLFDLFKQKKDSHEDVNSLLRLKLKQRLENMGYHVSLQGLEIIIESQLKISVDVIKDSRSQPSSLHLHLNLNNAYLPGDIEESIIGVGPDLHSQIDNALDNFITTTFLPVQSAFSESHKSDLDFMASIAGRDILFHPKTGKLGFLGEWHDKPDEDLFFNLVKLPITSQLLDRKFNWLKITLSQEHNGMTLVHCTLNNETWEEGNAILQQYVNSWSNPTTFRMVKQIIIFRLCDAYEQLI